MGFVLSIDSKARVQLIIEDFQQVAFTGNELKVPIQILCKNPVVVRAIDSGPS